MSNIPGVTKTWTDADDAVLRQGCVERLSFREIGARLGVSRRSAIGRAYRLGIKKGRPPQPVGTGARTTNLREKIARNVKAPIRLPRKKGLPPLQFAPLIERPQSHPETTPPIGPGRPLIDIPWNGCWFAVTEHETEQHLFCGAPKLTGHSYCAPHCLIAYAPPKKMMKLSEQERQRRRLQGLLNVQRGIYL